MGCAIVKRAESVSALFAALSEKRRAADAKRNELKHKIDQNIDAADALEKRAKKKRETAKSLYEKLGKIDYGSWIAESGMSGSSSIWPLMVEKLMDMGVPRADLVGILNG